MVWLCIFKYQGKVIVLDYGRHGGFQNTAYLALQDDSKASSATEMLREVLVIWNIDQTAKAAHCCMYEENQRRVVRWMIEHKDSTILPFAKV